MDSSDCFASFYFESSLRGYHAYYRSVPTVVGDIYECKQEPDNKHDMYAVKIVTIAEETLGHVPIEFSKIFSIFLQMGGIIECEVIGSRYNLGKGKGLEVPVDYRFIATSIKNIKNLCTAGTALEKLKTRSDQIV